MTYQVLLGDARARLRDLADGSAHCIVTSPPYWGLRDYGHVDQVGIEESVADYVAALVSVFAEARRVLRDDGTLWLNLGDSYSGGDVGGRLKAKDLVGVPWLVAFALRDAGWWLRAGIVWHKPHGMPEAVTDRVTTAHEYVFHLAKSARDHYDGDAIRTPLVAATLRQAEHVYEGKATKAYASAGAQNPSEIKRRVVERIRSAPARARPTVLIGANARSVWSISPEPSALPHFAIMPKALARKCIRTGCPPGGTVLDPFAGVGTTLVVALEEGRNAIGVELNPAYHAIARARCADVAPLFAAELPAPAALAERVS